MDRKSLEKGLEITWAALAESLSLLPVPIDIVSKPIAPADMVGTIERVRAALADEPVSIEVRALLDRMILGWVVLATSATIVERDQDPGWVALHVAAFLAMSSDLMSRFQLLCVILEEVEDDEADS